MEKKTIGAFIAALRKANGMTQKDLAERLNVSDKTISRWERDDGAPDLSAIPAIAEIFGVTCDELLRGQRRSPAQREEEPSEESASPKGEKQRQRLLKTALSQYKSRTYIAMGISVVGIIAALIGNLAFLRALLGFLLGAVFYAASIVCQAVFLNSAFLSVEDAGLAPGELSGFKRSVIGLAQKSIGLSVGFIGFTSPLVLVDAYMGLGADSLLLFGIPGAAIFLGIYAITCFFLNASLLKKGVYTLEGKEYEIYQHNHKLKKSYGSCLAAALIATVLIHALGVEGLWAPETIVKGITFEDYDSFTTYMELDIPAGTVYTSIFGSYEEVSVAPSEIPSEGYLTEESGATWYDKDGNEITQEEALTRTLEDKNGQVVCTYIQRNEAVSFIRYSAKEGTVLPITVVTKTAYSAALSLSKLITLLFCFAYPIEIAATLSTYHRKRLK